ncbi:Ephrin type-A receptor 8 [Tulasnella sp. 417]|nr:Ephrin type-A receptor 8 [Tulasnella sp. 417]
MSKWRLDANKLIFFDACGIKTGGSADIVKASLLDASHKSKIHNKGGALYTAAVKKFRFINGEDKQKQAASFAYELSLLEGLCHDNVIRLLGFVENFEEGIAWILLRWEPNGNVGDFVRSHNWMIPELVSLLNVMVNSQYSAVITDFGSCRKADGENGLQYATLPENLVSEADSATRQCHGLPRAHIGECGTSITLTGLGFTTRWAAPEVLADERFSLASDIWAFGWICWEVLTGTIPFSDIPRQAAVIAKVIRGDLPSFANNAQFLQVKALCTIMTRCWSREPGQRPAAKTCQSDLNWMSRTPPCKESTGRICGKSSLRAYLEQAMIHVDLGNLGEGVRCTREAIDIARAKGDALAIASTAPWLGDFLILQARFAEAEALYTEARDIWTRVGHTQGISDVTCRMGLAYRFQGRFDKAIVLYEKSRDISTRGADEIGVANATLRLAKLYCSLFMHCEAKPLFKKAREVLSRIGDEFGAAEAVMGLATALWECKEYDEAASLFNEARETYAQLGSERHVAIATLGWGRVLQGQRNYPAAEVMCSEAREMFIRVGDENGVAEAALALGPIHRLQDENEKAESFYVEAREIFTRYGYKEMIAEAAVGLGDIYCKRNNHAVAESLYNESREILRRVHKGTTGSLFGSLATTSTADSTQHPQSKH